MASAGMMCVACSGKCPSEPVTCSACRTPAYCSVGCREVYASEHARACKPHTPPQVLARKAVQYMASNALMPTFQSLCYGLQRRSADGATMSYLQLLVVGEPWLEDAARTGFFVAHVRTVGTAEYLQEVHHGLAAVGLVGKVAPELVPVVSICVPVSAPDPSRPNGVWRVFFYIWAPACPHPAGMYPERAGVPPDAVIPEQVGYLRYARERALTIIGTAKVSEEDFLGGTKALCFSMGTTSDGRAEVDISSMRVGAQAESRGVYSWMLNV
jgi:hypothetical protein